MRIAANRLILPVLLLLSATAQQAWSQQVLGRVGAACATLDAQNRIAVTLTQSVPAGAVLTASVVSRGTSGGNLRVVDPAGNTYRPVGALRSRARGSATVNLSARVASNLPSGSVITVNWGQAQSTSVACAAFLAVADLSSGPTQLHAPGGKLGAASTALALDLDRPGNGVAQLLIGGFALSGHPGTVSAPGSAQVQATVCSVDQTLCLLTAHDLSSSNGTLGFSLTTSNLIDWTGEAAGLYRDSIFADGLE